MQNSDQHTNLEEETWKRHILQTCQPTSENASKLVKGANTKNKGSWWVFLSLF